MLIFESQCLGFSVWVGRVAVGSRQRRESLICP